MVDGKNTVALVANTTWNIFNFRLNVLDKFLQEGWDVIVMAPIDEYLEYKEKYPQVRHVNIRTLDRDSKNPVKDVFLTLELIRKYKKFKPDLVIHYTNKPNIFGGIAAGFAKVRSIAVVTGLGYAFIRTGWIRSLTTNLYRFCSKNHERFIFENQEDKLLFEKLGITHKRQGYSVKGCGVNTNYYLPHPNGVEHETIIFTFIGRLLYDKGIREFIQAAELIKKENQKVEFWIVGEMDPQNPATIDKDDLIKWINNKTIIYHGFQRDVRPLVASSDCLVLPSYREGMPRIVMEGMSMAKAIITTDVAGCRETVDHGSTGYIVQAKKARALADAMQEYLNLSHDDRRAMGKKGREKAVKEFDDVRIAETFYQLVTAPNNGE